MSYLVLARKYRPSTFADLVGQEHVIRTLENAIQLNRVHHAFLFTGARGVGKTTTARILARALNCEQGPTATPCGVCSMCTEIGNGSSPDVLEIDGASNTGVDNVRELKENVRYRPSRGKYKLYIIDEVHMLSQAAFNALLKTLEEPPEHVKFIFATTEPQKIPVTILSRCQRFDFRRVGAEQLTSHLSSILEKEGLQLGPQALSYIVREAQGSVRDSLSLLDQVLSYGGEKLDDSLVIEALGVVDRQTIFQVCDAILSKNGSALLDLIAEIDARGHDMTDVAGLVVEHLRDLMVAKVSNSTATVLCDRAPAELESLETQAQSVDKALLHRLFALAVRVAEDVSRSFHPRVSLEMGLLRLLEAESAQSLESLLQKIDGFIKGGAPVGASQAGGPSRHEASRPAKAAAAPPRNPSQDSLANAARRPAGQIKSSASRSEPRPEPRPGVQSNAGSSSVKSSQSSAPVAAGQPATMLPSTAVEPWKRFVARVQQAGPALAAVLQHGSVVEFSPMGVTVGYPKESFYWASANDPDSKKVILKKLEEHFGQPVSFTIVASEEMGAQKPATLAEIREKEEFDEASQIKQDAIEHPAVKDTIALLGGEVENVTPLGSSSS